EGFEDVTAFELVAKPRGARVGSDHRGRQERQRHGGRLPIAVEERSASRTALFMTAYRARASARPNALCSDPWAAALAGEEGFELARRYDEIYPPMELWTAVRTAFI